LLTISDEIMRKTKHRKRESLDIQREILRAVNDHDNQLNLTAIMYLVEITAPNVFHAKLDPLVRDGYLVLKNCGIHHKHYCITETGKEYLKKLDELSHLKNMTI